MAASAKYFGQQPVGGILASGRYGIDLFFVISGFIIAIISLEGPRLLPAVSAREFFARRFTRIVPLMWIAIIAFMALRLGGRGEWMGQDYLRALLLLPWGTLQPSHIWTLRQEMIFYLLFAATMLTGRRWRFALALWVLGAFVAAPLLKYSPATIFDPVRLLFSPVNIEFAAGLVLAGLWLRRTRAFRVRLPVEPLIVLAALSGIAFWVSSAVFDLVGFSRGLGSALLLMPVVFLAIHVECPPGPLQRIGEMLGNASYSIYLFHPPIVSALLGAWARLALATPAWIVVLGCGIASAAAGVAIHFVIERPLIAALRRRFGPRTELRKAHPAG